MEILQGSIICYPTIYTKHTGSFFPFVINSVTKVKLVKSQNTGYKRFIRIKRLQQSKRGSGVVYCGVSSSSDDSGSTAENFRVNDEEYVNSTVIEAVEVRSGSDGFSIKMRDGELLRCIHNNPLSGNPLDYAPHPAIVLKMEDGSDLLLPIIVLEMPRVFLMATLRNVQIARPTIYQVVEEMIDKMGYEVQLVRVTKRVHEAYLARLYLVKDGDETEIISFDLRPSDAINIATRCKVPIQVNKQLVFTDGMKVVEQNKHMFQHSMTNGLLFTDLDKPNGQSCIEAKEFCLVRNMYVAAVEERYGDAAQLRDELTQLRSKRNS